MSKRQKDIKSKLMAAISMLLVSSIMMVSSTYAWFTLSTAPEVTGISTAVGANGNLEIALMPTSGIVTDITSESGDGNKDIAEKNVTWGNLVDLSDDTVYGLDKIKLYPSALNSDDGTTIGAILLKTPEYGADGRVTELNPNTVTALYTAVDGFDAKNAGYGVRAVGVSSGMSKRELDYTNALSSAYTAAKKAGSEAQKALEANGTALASIAVKHGVNTSATFTAADVTALSTMITDLEKALAQIDTAYMQYILAYAASKLNTNEDAYKAVKALVEGSADLEEVLDGLADAGLTLADLPVNAGITKYQATKGDVATAKTYLPATKDTYEWGDIDDVVSALADPTNMTVNNLSISTIQADPQALIDSYLALNKLTVAVPTGSGVFADIADQSGSYQAKISIKDVAYGTFKITEATAYMEINTTLGTPYLTAVNTGLSGQKPEANVSGDDEKTLTEMYGYVIDLAFRTNAANSDLKLQVEAVDRIYSDQTGASTMGHGASMTFSDISDDMIVTAEGHERFEKVRNLMSAIRIVFFDPTDGNTIIARAKLDAANATQDADGLTAELYLYTETAATYVAYPSDGAIETGVDYYTKSTEREYEAVTGVTAENFATYSNLYTKAADSDTYTAAGSVFVEGTTYYSSNTVDKYTKVEPAPTTNEGNLYVLSTGGRTEDTTLMGLNQNEATPLSVLVYLDGNVVGNDDVAYSMANSMSGTLNLQFSSSATLVPMEYRGLHQGTVQETPEEGGEEQQNAEGNS